MRNKSFWDSLKLLAKEIRSFTDELWKVWRWFGVSFIAFAAYDRGAGISTLIFGIAVTTIGVSSLSGWILSRLIGGLTEKGRNAGKWGTIFTACFLFFLTIFFSIYAWAVVATIAYPVFY